MPLTSVGNFYNRHRAVAGSHTKNKLSKPKCQHYLNLDKPIHIRESLVHPKLEGFNPQLRNPWV